MAFVEPHLVSLRNTGPLARYPEMEASFFLAMTVFRSANEDRFQRVARELCLCGIGSLHCREVSKKAASCWTKLSTAACVNCAAGVYGGLAALGTKAKPDRSALGRNSWCPKEWTSGPRSVRGEA